MPAHLQAPTCQTAHQLPPCHPPMLLQPMSDGPHFFGTPPALAASAAPLVLCLLPVPHARCALSLPLSHSIRAKKKSVQVRCPNQSTRALWEPRLVAHSLGSRWVDIDRPVHSRRHTPLGDAIFFPSCPNRAQRPSRRTNLHPSHPPRPPALPMSNRLQGTPRAACCMAHERHGSNGQENPGQRERT